MSDLHILFLGCLVGLILAHLVTRRAEPQITVIEVERRTPEVRGCGWGIVLVAIFVALFWLAQ